jgi:hypothetical protein
MNWSRPAAMGQLQREIGRAKRAGRTWAGSEKKTLKRIERIPYLTLPKNPVPYLTLKTFFFPI